MRFVVRVISALVVLILAQHDGRSASPQGDPDPAPRGLVRRLGSTGYRHPAPIQHACLDPTVRTLFTLSEKGVYTWDLQTGDSRLLFEAERLRNALSLSPDGRMLASIAGDAVAIWDAKTGELIKEFEDSHSAGRVEFRPDGKGVIIFREDRIESRPLDGNGSKTIGATPPHCRPVFAADGKWFAASTPGEFNGEINTYDVRSLQKKAVLRVGAAALGEAPNGLPMLRAGFSADGSRLAVPTADGSIAIWDIGAGKVVQTLKPRMEKRRPREADCRYFLFAQDGKRLFAGTGAGAIRRWDVETGQELAPLRGHRDAVRSLHLTRGGGQLVSTSADGMIRRWDLAAGRELEPPDGYSGSLHARLSPGGESVLLLDAAGRMDIWNLGNGRLRTPIRPPGDASLDTPWVEPFFGFTPDGKRVFLAETNGKISIYDAGSGKVAASLALPGYLGRAMALRFCISTPDGQAFVVNRSYGRLRLIRASDGRDIWESPEFTPRGICYPPVIAGDGKSIFLGVTTFGDQLDPQDRGRVELVRLDLASGKVVTRTQLPTAFKGDTSFLDQPRLGADGRILIMLFGVAEVLVADTVANRALHHYPLHLQRPELSADGKRIIGVFLQEIAVFETTTGKKLSQLPIGKQTVQSLHVLPDGRHVFTSGDGGHACLWDLNAASPSEGGPE